ncbi:hypothetical protein WJX72_007126 [[Myrmecia] bisecta]|uniref:coproporphyrinogen oxidase n=1 Tax=[Myrmecia] bisecta TaxID=41462 RepID=A0AAW1QSB5_9CHLO
MDAVPETLLRAGDVPSSMRGTFERIIRKAQDKICSSIEAVDGCKFGQDAWTRPGGGGGVTRVLQDGNVWEKAGVGVSIVFGKMPQEAYQAATGTNTSTSAGKDDMVSFFAASISCVMHPRNPHCPTMHFNYRYFETEEWNGSPAQWWFGGGTDITPSYVNEEDMRHFHGVYKRVCDAHDPSYYPRFKQWADDYFLIKHRNERLGLGGIFFDNLRDQPREDLLHFSADALEAVCEAYLPIIEWHKDDPYTETQKEWQQLRRGRYVEYNLIYDRGTTFGLKTGGRTESILMSLPLTCRFEYCHQMAPASPEADLLDACTNPRTWV